MSDALVTIDRDGEVATLTFNDPAHRNAMTEAMGEAFRAAMADLARAEGLRALVLTGAGRAFSAGGDMDMIDARAQLGAAHPDGSARGEIAGRMRAFYGLFLSVRDLPFPTVAAVNGAAIGAGLCVALACDLRLVAQDARLALNFTRLGLHPGMGATWTLPRLVGPAAAAELLLTGRLFTGEEAARLGVANRALPAGQVLAEAQALAGEIAAAAPLAVQAVKRALAHSPRATLEEQLALEAELQAATFESADVQEGIAAVRARRAPRFAGR